MSQWQSVGDFLNMGGYAFYVWGSYLVSFALILGEIFYLRHSAAQVKKRLKRLARLQEKIPEQ